VTTNYELTLVRPQRGLWVAEEEGLHNANDAIDGQAGRHEHPFRWKVKVGVFQAAVHGLGKYILVHEHHTYAKDQAYLQPDRL